MSDSDCSNCDREDCEYYEYSYNCYRIEVTDLQQHMTVGDQDLFRKTLVRCKELEDETFLFSSIIQQLQEVLSMYEETLILRRYS